MPNEVDYHRSWSLANLLIVLGNNRRSSAERILIFLFLRFRFFDKITLNEFGTSSSYTYVSRAHNNNSMVVVRARTNTHLRVYTLVQTCKLANKQTLVPEFRSRRSADTVKNHNWCLTVWDKGFATSLIPHSPPFYPLFLIFFARCIRSQFFDFALSLRFLYNYFFLFAAVPCEPIQP